MYKTVRRFDVKMLCQSWSDDSAGVIAARIDNVESYSRSKIYDHGRRAEMMANGNCIGQSIRANAGRFWIVDADPSQCSRSQFQTLQLPNFPNRSANQRRGLRHNTTRGGPAEFVFSNEFG